MASRADTWMPFYVADYLKDTMHLTRDLHGGYLLLLMACWNGGGRLPNDNAQLAALARATPSEWRKMAPILRRFFTVDGDELVHGRVVQEHEKAQRLSDIRRENGGKGGRPKKQTETGEKATGLAKPKLTETPSPSPVGREAIASTPTQDADASFVARSSDFDRFWAAYPAKVGKKAAARAWAKAKDRPALPAVLESLERYKRTKPVDRDWCNPATWLNEGRWDDGEPAGAASDGGSSPTFNAPQVRASIVQATDEDFARRYVDHYCRWIGGEARRLEAKTPAVAAALTSKLAAWAASKEVTIAVAAANDTPALKEDAAA